VNRRTRRLTDRPGLQPERTALSWDRTAIGLLANGALLVFRSNHAGQVVLYVAAAFALLATLTCALVGRYRHHQIVTVATTGIRAFPGGLLTVSGLIVGLGLIVLVAALSAL
jgi:uncharacterized membrane protein YidH (DUF202 family)